MSIRAWMWAWGLYDLPLRESMVLVALADEAGDRDDHVAVGFLDRDRLAPKCRMSRTSLDEVLESLCASGLVEVVLRSEHETYLLHLSQTEPGGVS